MENFKPALLFDAEGDLSQRWFIYYYFRDPETGKMKRFRQWVPMSLVTRSLRYIKAREMIKTMNTKLRQGFNPFSADSKGQTNILKALDIALEKKSPSLRKRTNQSYKSYVKYFKIFLSESGFSKMSVEGFSYEHGQTFMDWYQKTRKISNRTYNNVLLSMHAIFQFLVKRFFLIINPFDNIDYLPIDEPGIIRFEPWERKLIYHQLPEFNLDLFVISQLIFGCFLRPQEIMRLKIKHMLLDRGEIIIEGKMGKNHQSRIVGIPDKILPEILRLDLDYPLEYFVFSFGLHRGPKENYPTRISDLWRVFARSHGINKGLYGLKHTANGLAADAKMDLRNVQLHNRHASINQTEVYLRRFRKTTNQEFRHEFPAFLPEPSRQTAGEDPSLGSVHKGNPSSSDPRKESL